MSSWRNLRLKDLCIDAGQYGLNVSAETYVQSGVRLLRTTDISSGVLTPDESGVFVETVPEARFTLTAGDLLLSRSGTPPGQSYLVRPADAGMTFAGYLVRFRPRSNADPRFLAYVARSAPFQHTIQAESVSSTIQNFNAERYANIRVAAPDVTQQRRIADFLDAATSRIDALRDLSLRQTNLLAHRLQELMRRETSAGRHRTVKTGVPWMPEMAESWKLFKVSREFRTASGTTPTSTHEHYYTGPHPWVNSSDVRDSVIEHVEKSVTDEALQEFPALKLIPAGSLVVALYGQGATKGRVGILTMDACLNQACCALIPSGDISTEYAYYWFRAHKEGIVAQAVGAGQPNLSQELMRELRIPAPDRAAQREIVRRLSAQEAQISAQIKLLQRRDALLRERRRSLITSAVTGQFDVTTASGRNVTEGVSA
ncbi:restriction endonuclease subunit S [Streptomyces sp. F001]|uniref:restriction endonuclease subunit S n=1 Tax=Streptomyces sp. F001 TaxID=1510026 RepID=UPI00101E458E|nr:restriction endonuclease subunit S [Streptomyces sp. F001]RZB16861.1 restriction endonuclease subunit S [Streptomyces sp. F001]